MSARKKAKVTIPTKVYTDSTEIIRGLHEELAKLPPSGGAASLGPMSGEITVFLVSFGKFRLVQRGHEELWNKLVEAARDILNDPQLAGRVNVCIDISSYDKAIECPADGGMSYLDLSEHEKLSERLKSTVEAKKVFCERSVPTDKRIQDIRTIVQSLLVANGIDTNPNLSTSVTSTPFNIVNPRFSTPSCGSRRAACDALGMENKCLVIFVGGSDRVGGGGKDDLVGKFMVNDGKASPIPHGLLLVGGDRKGVGGDSGAILLDVVGWAIGSSPPTELKIPMAAFSSSFIDYAVDMCLWACVPKPAIERIIEATTIHSDPASIVETKAKQLDARIHNVVELHKHAAILSGRLAPIQPGMTKKEAGETARTNKAYAEAYSTPPAAGAAGTDVMQHMSYKMVIDSLMLQGLAAISGSPPVYRRFAGRTPTNEDFERLLSWSMSRWWKDKAVEKKAADNVKAVLAISQVLAAGGVPASCTWWLSGLEGGRRTRRKRNTRKKRRQRHAARTRQNHRGSKTCRRVAPRAKRR